MTNPTIDPISYNAGIEAAKEAVSNIEWYGAEGVDALMHAEKVIAALHRPEPQTENCEGVTAHLASEFLPPADAVRLALADEMERWREDMVPRPADEYHEDMGSALWWKFPIEEPPYVGGPNDLGQTVEVTVQAFGVDKMMRVNVGGWPGYHTHFTPIPLPSAPKNTDKEG